MKNKNKEKGLSMEPCGTPCAGASGAIMIISQGFVPTGSEMAHYPADSPRDNLVRRILWQLVNISKAFFKFIKSP